jgi:RNA polymerase sigma factor (sigma-70 family)
MPWPLSDLWRHAPPEPLVDAFRAGEDDVFAFLYDALRRPLRRQLAAILRDPVDVDDAVCETWAAAFEKRSHYAGRGALAGWILVIGRNKAREMRRREGSAARDTLAMTDGFAGAAAADRTPLALAEARERLLAALAEGIERLAPRQAAVLREHGLRGARFRAIARTLGMSEATARATYRDALRLLRRRLESEGMTPRELRELLTTDDYTFLA